MKIDVEELELNVLQVGKQTLARTKFLIVEISLARDEDCGNQAVFKIYEFLHGCGFALYSLIDIYSFDEPEPHLGMAQFDAIFRRVG